MQSSVGGSDRAGDPGEAFGVLEPDDGKLSRPVLRGACELVTVLWAGNRPGLPDLLSLE